MNRTRTKTNYMIDDELLVQITTWIPAGERSDFVNEALERALLQRRREKAFKAMDELRLKAKIKITDKAITRLKNYGRP